MLRSASKYCITIIIFFVESSKLFTASLLACEGKSKQSEDKAQRGGARVFAQSKQEKWRDCFQLWKKVNLLGCSCYHLVTNTSAN